MSRGLLFAFARGFCPLSRTSFVNRSSASTLQERNVNSGRFNQRSWVVKDCRSLEEILRIASENIDNLSPNTLAAVWSTIPRLMMVKQRQRQSEREDPEKLRGQIMTVLKHTRNSMKKTRQKELATVTLGIAKIVKNVRDGKQSRRLNTNQQVFRGLFLDDKANLTASIFQPLTKRANDILMEFEPRYLSNLAYAYALLGYDPKLDNGSTLLENIAEASIDVIDQFNAQGISNSVWACAKLEVSHSTFFRAVGDAIVRMQTLESFEPQALANTVWAYATCTEQHPTLFKKVGDEIVTKENLASFNPQNLANTVWAYATANEQHHGLFKKVGDEIVMKENLTSFNPQDFTNTVWAYATANEHHHGLFKKVGDEIIVRDNLASFNPQALANIVWAYATSNEQHHGLFKKVGDEIVVKDNLASFDPQALANTVWAYATANEQHPNLFQKVGDEISKIDDFKSFSTQALANTAWAYSVLNYDIPLMYDTAFREVLLDRQYEFNIEGMRQLYQWHLWQTKEKANNGLPASLQDNCKQAFLSAGTKKSAFQKDVVRELKIMNLNPVEEYRTKSGYSLDALIEIKGKKVGVEVDGPSHFIGREPNGSTLLKRRQVRSIDEIPLVSMLYWEWDKLGNDRGKKQKYLQTLLGSKLNM